MDSNKNIYEKKEIADYYQSYKDLQPAEKIIIDLLNPNLHHYKMLDIGVGGGRTSSYFIPKVKNYIGIDYSHEMINTCIKLFGNKYPETKFELKDARNIEEYESSSFDLILFSFNGIDYMNIEERFDFISKSYNLLKPDGYLCFSSHNTLFLEKLFSFTLRKNIFKMFKQIIDLKKLKKINKEEITNNNQNYKYINDGAHDFMLSTCYTEPSYQKQIIIKSGFSSVNIFSNNSTSEINFSDSKILSNSPWIYYLCKK